MSRAARAFSNPRTIISSRLHRLSRAADFRSGGARRGSWLDLTMVAAPQSPGKRPLAYGRAASWLEPLCPSVSDGDGSRRLYRFLRNGRLYAPSWSARLSLALLGIRWMIVPRLPDASIGSQRILSLSNNNSPSPSRRRRAGSPHSHGHPQPERLIVASIWPAASALEGLSVGGLRA